MEACISAVRNWMAAHFLKMNSEKTEFLLISSKRMQAKLPAVQLQIGDHVVLPSQTAKNLGVTMDSNASMEKHIAMVSRASYLQLRRLRRIKEYLPRDALESLVHAFISSRLDYCNALYLGIPKYQLARLQRIQNCAARLLTGDKMHEHVTSLLNWIKALAAYSF